MMPSNKITALHFFEDSARQWEDSDSASNWLDGIAQRSKLCRGTRFLLLVHVMKSLA